jgi:formamidopyrimidine-DNA glycosylase
MPEGPECHYTAFRLNAALKDKTLTAITIIDGRYKKHGPPNGLEELQQAIEAGDVVVRGVCAKGKLIYFLLSNHMVILSTLGLKGAWTRKFEKHCGIAVEAVGPPITFWFRDQLHYGTLSVIPLADLPTKLASLGADVTVGEPIEGWLGMCRKSADWEISKFLMNQSRIAGIGNYLKSEVLYAAKICPHAIIGDINDEQLLDLEGQIMTIPAASYKAKRRTGPLCPLKVYNKRKDPDGNLVVKTKTSDGRNSHWVPAVQDPDQRYSRC